MDSSTLLPDFNAPFSKRSRAASGRAFGEMPITFLKIRCKWVGETCTRVDSVLRDSGSSACASMYRASVCIRSTALSLVAGGLHRLQDRNPVRSAASGFGKKRTLPGLAGRDAQDGRQ